MTNGQTPEPETPMEDAGGVSGMVNLTINLPDNIRISTVDSEEEEATVSNGNTTGMIQIFAGPTAPAGWLMCNGAEASRVTYADLFAEIGTNYGVGNGSTTFNLPDLRGRFPLGKDDMGEVSAERVTAAQADALGGVSGSETHTLTVDEMPAHDHELKVRASGNSNRRDGLMHTDSYNASLTHLMIAHAGGDAAHNNMPPYQTLNYIIKT